MSLRARATRDIFPQSSRVLETKTSSGTQGSSKISTLFAYLRLGFDFFSPIC